MMDLLNFNNEKSVRATKFALWKTSFTVIRSPDKTTPVPLTSDVTSWLSLSQTIFSTKRSFMSVSLQHWRQ